MKMNPVGWFEISCNDLDRATKFYGAVFGFAFTREKVGEYELAMFPMEREAPGAAGALITGQAYVPSRTGTIVYFPVKDIAATLAKIEQNGGKTTLPKKSIGKYGFIAWFEDCEGNSVALHAMSWSA